MKNFIAFTQPDKFCRRCGALIPGNEDYAALKAAGIKYSPGLLGCVHCAIAAGPPGPGPAPGSRRRLSRRALEATGQQTMISPDLPSIFIGRRG